MFNLIYATSIQHRTTCQVVPAVLFLELHPCIDLYITGTVLNVSEMKHADRQMYKNFVLCIHFMQFKSNNNKKKKKRHNTDFAPHRDKAV